MAKIAKTDRHKIEFLQQQAGWQHSAGDLKIDLNQLNYHVSARQQ